MEDAVCGAAYARVDAVLSEEVVHGDVKAVPHALPLQTDETLASPLGCRPPFLRPRRPLEVAARGPHAGSGRPDEPAPPPAIDDGLVPRAPTHIRVLGERPPHVARRDEEGVAVSRPPPAIPLASREPAVACLADGGAVPPVSGVGEAVAVEGAGGPPLGFAVEGAVGLATVPPRCRPPHVSPRPPTETGVDNAVTSRPVARPP